MAWRDGRTGRAKLMLFMASIVLGIAAVVSIQSFSDNLKQNIVNESKSLLGADIAFRNNQEAGDSIQQFFDSLEGRKSQERNFASMVAFPGKGGTKLVQIRALEGNFPFYGKLETSPQSAAATFQQNDQALVDATLMVQFNLKPGDSIKVGNRSFGIAGALEKVPGQTGITATVAPPVYIKLQSLEATGLMEKGSRINFQYYFALNDPSRVEHLLEDAQPILEEEGMRYDTPETTGESLGRSYENVGKFLNLVAFIALLLGCVGVASAIHIYIKEKVNTVAVLRCLGASNWQTFAIFLIQIAFIGFLGALLGAMAGSFIQLVFPRVFAEFLPVDVTLTLSWSAILLGISLGFSMALLFALLPLAGVWGVSPLSVLRADAEKGNTKTTTIISYAIVGLIVIFILLFAYLQLGDWRNAGIFTFGILLSLGILTGLANLLMAGIKRFFPSNWPFIYRQSLSNLFRPGNQTHILVLSIGLGTFLISILYFTQNILVNAISLQSSTQDPNIIVFDIQNDQKDDLRTMVEDLELPVLQEVPIVTMRLHSLRGKETKIYRDDSTSQVRRWVLNREYRVSYSATLTDAETVNEGQWVGEFAETDGAVPVSLSENIAEDMQAEIGDAITFNVQGALLEAKVGSIRKVEWNRIQTNFMVMFPVGVLENAPQFHVLATRTPDNQVAAALQQQLVAKFPNVSIVDVSQILASVDEILTKIAWVISFMAFFSIFTGFIVLIGAVLTSKFQRMRESVLLRTLGARKKLIKAIIMLEYFYLGSLASLSGIVLALIGSWLLSWYTFEVSYTPSLWPAAFLYFGITGTTLLIGLWSSRDITNNPPLQVLRKTVAA